MFINYLFINCLFTFFQVRQVAMLLDEWKLVYPESRETVQSFVDKVRHLKAQKELIKKHLGITF